MRKKNLLYLLLLSASTLISSCAKEDVKNENNDDSSVNIAPDVIVFSYDKFTKEDDVTITSSDTTTLTVDKNLLKEYNIEDINIVNDTVPLVVWRTMNTVPFVRNVIKTVDKGDKIEFTTIYGDMGDVFPDSEFNLQTDLYINPAQSRTIRSRSGAEMINPERYVDDEGVFHPAVYIVHEGISQVDENGNIATRAGSQESVCFTAEELYADNASWNILNIDHNFGNIKVGLQDKGSNTSAYLYAKNMHLKALAGLRVNVNTKWFKLKYFECIAYGNFAGSATLGINVSKSFDLVEQEQKLATLGACSGVFWIGIVPVAVTAEMGLKAVESASITASCDISTDFSFHANYESGLVYNGSWRTINNGSAGCDNTFNATANASLGCECQIAALVYANVKLYGCLGPELGLGPQINLGANLSIEEETSNGNVERYLRGEYYLQPCVSGSLQAQLSVWKWSIAKWSYPFTLWEGEKKGDDFEKKI